MSGEASSPVQLTERAEILDVLRGFAILGIFIANSANFSGYLYCDPEQKKQLVTYASDQWVNYFFIALVEGKFYSLFSLLFGIGFSVILIRNEQKGKNPLPVFYRRLGILMLFGFLHAFLVWDGDILLLYGLTGLLLPLFRALSDRALLIAGIILLLSPIFIDLVKLTFSFTPAIFLNELAQRFDKQNGIPLDNTFVYYLFQPGSGYKEILNWNLSGFFYRYAYLLDSNRVPKVLAMFLIGFVAGRKMMYVNLVNHVSLLKKLQRFGFIIGLPLSFAMAYFELDNKSIPNDPAGLLDSITYALSVVPLSLAFTATICLWWINTNGVVLTKLAAVGRMALTNYILQSVIGILIYYNIGFGLGLKFGPAIFIPVAIIVFASQVVISNIWFRYFMYGPLEWIWRQLTYGKKLPLRKLAL